MPYIPSDNPGFSYKNPAYQSAHPQCGADTSEERAVKATDDTNMKKWKGVVFSVEEDKKKSEENCVLERDNEVIFKCS